MMNLQELQTIHHYNIPVKIFLINNEGYLAIKNTQNSFFQGNLVAVDGESGVSFPSFAEVAKTFKLAYFEIKDHSNIKEVITESLLHPGPVLCEIRMSPTQPLFPKVYSEKLPDGTMVSKPLEDMFPFLDRDEFNQNMS
jgi:acetolactate synthase-1/2/3 large subunit